MQTNVGGPPYLVWVTGQHKAGLFVLGWSKDSSVCGEACEKQIYCCCCGGSLCGSEDVK